MTTIKLKNGSGAPAASDLVQGEPALDLTNKRLYTENASGTVIEVGTNPTSLTTGTFTSTGIDDNATSIAITIDSSENVGIGTTSPDSGPRLHLSKGSAGTVDSHANSVLTIEDDSTAILQFLTPANEGIQLRFGDPDSNGVGLIEYGHGTDNLNFHTAGSERMRIDSSGNLLVNSTSAGALASSGRGLIDVDGTSDSAIELKAGGSTYGYLYASSSQFRVANLTANPVTFFTSNTERMRIDGSGDVGIGTSSIDSSYKLNVEGAVIPILAKSSSTSTSPRYACVATARPSNVVGSGSGYGMNMNNSSGNMTEYGYIGGLIESNTAGSQSGALVFAPTSSGTRTERMRINSSGNVGIGTATPTSSSGWAKFINIGGTDTNALILDGTESQQAAVGAVDGLYLDCVGSSTASKNKIIFRTQSANSNYNGSERMRIDSSGNVLVGVTSTISAGDEGIQLGSNGMITTARNQTSTQTHMAFVNPNGTVGSITTLNNATSFTPSSDVRFKENIRDYDNALADVMKLKPRKYSWKADGTEDNGFIAQELLETPEFANRAMPMEEGDDPKYGVDYMKFVAVLTGAIQEQQIMIEQLKAEVAALKGE
jgi:hypothetical protein